MSIRLDFRPAKCLVFAIVMALVFQMFFIPVKGLAEENKTPLAESQLEENTQQGENAGLEENTWQQEPAQQQEENQQQNIGELQDTVQVQEVLQPDNDTTKSETSMRTAVQPDESDQSTEGTADGSSGVADSAPGTSGESDPSTEGTVGGNSEVAESAEDAGSEPEAGVLGVSTTGVLPAADQQNADQDLSQYAVTYDYNAFRYQQGDDNYAGVYATEALTVNEKAATEAETIGMPSIADPNLDAPTLESPAIIQGAAVGYEIKTGPVDYTVLQERVEPYSEYKYTIMEEQAQDGTVHKKLSGFDKTYVITRLDVSNFFADASTVETAYLHLKQDNNSALMPAFGQGTLGTYSFVDQTGNMTGSYRMSDLIDKTGVTSDTPYIDVLLYSTASVVAGADAGKENTPNGDVPIQLYVDDTADYNPDLKFDPQSTDPNHATQVKAKYFDASKASAAGAAISSYLVKGSDLALEIAVENSGGVNKDTDTTYWSLKKGFQEAYYDQAQDSNPNDPASGRTMKLINEVAITDGLTFEGTDAEHLRKRVLDVNTYDIQIASNTTPDQQTYTSGMTLQNAWLTIADKSNTTGAEMAIGNNAKFVIDSGAKLIIDETCQLEIEFDAATTQPGTGGQTQPADILNNGMLDLRAGGEIVNNGIITVEGTEGKPHQQGTQPASTAGFGEMTIDPGATLTNNGSLMVYGKLYNLGTLVNNGKYNAVITSNDPDKGRFEYHKGIVVSWKDDVTQAGVVPGALINGMDRNGALYSGATVINNGDIVLAPGTIENYQTLINRRGAHIYVAAALDAVIPIEPTQANPTVVSQRIQIDPPKASAIYNYGTIYNDGRIEPATVETLDNGGLGKLTAPGKTPELFALYNAGIVVNYGCIYGWPALWKEEAAMLYLRANKTFTVVYPDGKRLNGTFEFEGDGLVFTAADGARIAGSGNVYQFNLDSASAKFEISAETIGEIRAAIENENTNAVYHIRALK